jgi:hypothetical protein
LIFTISAYAAAALTPLTPRQRRQLPFFFFVFSLPSRIIAARLFYALTPFCHYAIADVERRYFDACRYFAVIRQPMPFSPWRHAAADSMPLPLRVFSAGAAERFSFHAFCRLMSADYFSPRKKREKKKRAAPPKKSARRARMRRKSAMQRGAALRCAAMA